MKTKVVVGLSGGVDSSVAAYLLKEQGYDVIGMFMRNYHDTTGTLSGDCPWEDDRMFAQLVAKKLDIEFHYIDLSEDYGKRVVDYMFAEYGKGRTPNPDVLCNREIKFDAFAKAAFKLGAEYVATGHYCRQQSIDGEVRLLSGVDKNKDQSYFLCQVTQQQMSKALFPIGHLQKSEVRKIAEEQGLATAKRKDSQGICFVGKVDLPVFLQQKLKSKEGEIVEIDNAWSGYNVECNKYEPFNYQKSDGKVVGKHHGAQYFTIGQRKGLGVGGKVEPLFVIAVDVDANIVYVGMGDAHKGLYRSGLKVENEELSFVRNSQKMSVGDSKRFKIRIRYRQPLQDGVVTIKEDGAYVDFDVPQRGVSAGQFAAWYDLQGDEMIGSGVISK